MKNPFIPKGKAKLVIIDRRVSRDIISNLKKLDLDVIETIECKEVDKSIAYHPDIVIHPLDEKTILIAPNVFEYYLERLKKYDFNLIKGKSVLTSDYPGDISYNIGRMGRHTIHNSKYTDEVAREYFIENNIEMIDVKQGYGKCSLADFGDGLGITSDKIIHERLTKLGYKVLLIQPGFIDLEYQKYGFIGGCIGNLDGETIVVTGRLDRHPDRDKIEAFLADNGKKLMFLSDENILDVGTIMIL